MSIFLEVTREFVMNAIDNIKKRLDADDNAYGGLLRDRMLSEAKKTAVVELLNFVRVLKDARSDYHTKDILIREIMRTKSETFKKSHDSGQGEGKLGTELSDLHSLVELIYSKFEQCNILNLEHNRDPYHVFAFQAGCYLGFKAAQTFQGGVVDYLTHHPNVSDLWKLTNEKEVIIRTQLAHCKAALEALNPHHPQIQEHYKNRVLDFIDAVIRENEKACSKHKAFLNLPLITFGFLSLFSAGSSIAPKPGFLEVCMIRAKTSINGVELKSETEEPAAAAESAQDEEDDEAQGLDLTASS